MTPGVEVFSLGCSIYYTRKLLSLLINGSYLCYLRKLISLRSVSIMRFKSSGELFIFILNKFFNFFARVANFNVYSLFKTC